MPEFVSLRAAVGDLIQDGATVAMEGFTHLIPFGAGHEVIRQGKRDLTLVRMTPDLIFDQMIGMGCARRLVFSWGGNPGVGSLHRLRDAVESGHPVPIEIEEHSHAGMSTRYVAGASGLPFGILRGYRGSDLVSHTRVATVTCPFTGEEIAAVPALTPDVTVIHAQQADRRGNIGLWGITGVQREAALSARAVVVTVEEIVDELRRDGPNHAVLPHWTIDSISEVPGGSHPSYSMGYSTRDNRFYTEWDRVSRDRDLFARWIDIFIMGTEDTSGYLAALANPSLADEVFGG